MKKTFVLDTNVLLHNAGCVEAFADNTVVIPMAVIEELDKFKAHNDELGRAARQVIRCLDTLRLKGRLGEGVTLPNGGTLRIFIDPRGQPAPDLESGIPDNKIIRVAYALKQTGDRVIFVSKDINARIKSDALGIETMDFEKQKVNFDELFSGFRQVSAAAGQFEALDREGALALPDLTPHPNEFVVLEDPRQPGRQAIVRGRPGGLFQALGPRAEGAWNIKARSPEQRMAFELLFDESVSLVTLVGRAGTGKTLLALAAGLELTRNKLYDKMLVSRPIMPLGKDIGFLPGDKDAKLTQWMQPIFDNLAFLMRDGGDGKRSVRDKIERLQRDQVVELEALTYIRGRSIPRQYVIIDEAQNLTPHEVKTIISRAGDGTKMVLTGDPSQIDNPYLDSNSNGLSFTVERMKDSPLHGHVTLRQSERSPLAALAAERL